MLIAIHTYHGLRVTILLDLVVRVHIFQLKLLMSICVGRLVGVRAPIRTDGLELLVPLLLLLQVIDAQQAKIVIATQTLQYEIKVPQADRAVVLVLELLLPIVGQEVAAVHVLDFECRLHLDV